MTWTATTPPTPILTWDQMKAHLRLADERHRPLVMEYVAQATAHAERMLASSLSPRTITASFDSYEDDITLPRGPILTIDSVTDANGGSVRYHRRDVGNTTRLHLCGFPSYPITVVYHAGYSTVPADFIGVIRIHAATLFAWREDFSAASVSTVHKLDEFYKAHSRGAPVS